MELPYTHKLLTPVEHGSETITELVFSRAPVAKDLRGIRLSELDKADHLITVTSRLSGQPPSVIERLSVSDTMACFEVVSAFLSPGPRTGSGPAD